MAAKPLPEMLFDDKANMDNKNWDDYIDNVICRCANAAFEKQYTHFSLQSLSQCYSGPNVAETYKKDGESDSCVGTGGNPASGEFKACSTPNLFCVGADKSNYVFGLTNGMGVSLLHIISSNYGTSSITLKCSVSF